MTTGRERETLRQLYDELRKFAPVEVADEMSQLAVRLSEIAGQSANPLASANGLGAVWQRVEQYLSDHPQDPGDASDLDPPGG